MSLLIPDGARSPHRCAVKGCPTVPEGDRLVCPIHGRILADIATRQVTPTGVTWLPEEDNQ